MTKGRYHKLIYALQQIICTLRPNFEKHFTGTKVWRKVQKISVWCKTVYEIDPWFEMKHEAECEAMEQIQLQKAFRFGCLDGMEEVRCYGTGPFLIHLPVIRCY